MPAPDDDVSVRRIAGAGAIIVATVALAVGFVVLELHHWNVPTDGGRSERPRDLPGPDLQSAPQPDLQRYLEEKRRTLESTAWVDQAAGVARIPIEEAMRLFSERGLRAAPGAQPPSSQAQSSLAARTAAAAISAAKSREKSR